MKVIVFFQFGRKFYHEEEEIPQTHHSSTAGTGFSYRQRHTGRYRQPLICRRKGTQRRQIHRCGKPVLRITVTEQRQLCIRKTIRQKKNIRQQHHRSTLGVRHCRQRKFHQDNKIQRRPEKGHRTEEAGRPASHRDRRSGFRRLGNYQHQTA